MRNLLLLLLLGELSLCYHFTCDQIRNKLIPSQIQIPGKYACVVFENPLPEKHEYFYDELRLRESGTGKEYSFIDVYNSCNYCVEGEGPWEVLLPGEFSSDSLHFSCSLAFSNLPESGYPMECLDEIIVLFTSQPTKVIPSLTDGRHCDVPKNDLITVVSPNSGAIQLKGTPSPSESVKVYFGVGRDEAEEMYLIRDNELSFHITMFDWVISLTSNYKNLEIASPPPVKVFINFDSPDLYQTKAFLYSSAALGNAYWRTYLTAKIALPKDRGYSVRVTGAIQYDSKNMVNFDEQGDQHLFANSGDVNLLLEKDSELFYLTYADANVVKRVNETFLLSFELVEKSSSTRLPATVHANAPTTMAKPTEPARSTRTPTTEPTRATRASTKLPSQSTPSTALPTGEPIANSDSYCSCDLDEDGLVKDWVSQLWLDIVILVDTSKTMGSNGVDEVSSLIESLAGKMNLDSNGPSLLYSRVGLISMSNTVEVIYNLNLTSDSDVHLKQSDQLSVDIEAGFQAAMRMFKEGKLMTNYRESAREIIYLITNSAPQGNLNGVYEFQSTGGIVIIANYVREGQVPLYGLQALASPYYFFANLTDNYMYNLQVFCDGGCYSVSSMGIPYKNALKTCSKEDSVMPSIHDDEKQFFLSSIVSSIGPKTKYWIGYENDGNKWNWVDKVKSTNPYSNWDLPNGQPNTHGGKNQCAYAVQTSGFNTEWYASNCDAAFSFVCEKAPCAAGRFCEA